jgi:hypothetical protein
MKNVIAIFLIMICANQNLCAQDTTGLHRAAYKQSLAVKKKSTFEQQVPASPYVFPDKTIQIFPGETIFVEISLNNSDIVAFEAVKQITDSSSTIILNLKQVSENGVHKQMMLTIYNPFQKKLSYQALMSTLKNRNWIQTDVWPVEPKLSGIEMWPDLILSLGLGHWKFQD